MEEGRQREGRRRARALVSTVAKSNGRECKPKVVVVPVCVCVCVCVCACACACVRVCVCASADTPLLLPHTLCAVATARRVRSPQRRESNTGQTNALFEVSKRVEHKLDKKGAVSQARPGCDGLPHVCRRFSHCRRDVEAVCVCVCVRVCVCVCVCGRGEQWLQ
jgi:hypothetical protein